MGEKLKSLIPWWTHKILQDNTPFRKFHITKGLGAGGSWGAAIWHLYLTLEINNALNSTSWVIAPTYAQIEDPCITTIVEILEKIYNMHEGEDYKLNTSGRPKIVFKNNVTISFRSAEKAQNLVGSNITHIWVTEPGLLKETAFGKLTGRMRSPKSNRLQWLLEGTPEGDTHWRKLADFPEGVDEKLNKVRFILHTADNKFIRPGYVEEVLQAYGHDEAKKRSYTLGEFADFVKGTAYWEYSEARVRVFKTYKDPKRTLNLAWDFNKSPLAWVCFQRFHHEKLYTRREVFEVHGVSNGEAKGLLDAVADFAVQYPVEIFGDTLIEIDGDVSGNHGSWKTDGSDYDNIIKYLKSIGYGKIVLKVPSDNPDVRPRLERVNALMAYDRIKVHTTCQNLHHSFSKTQLVPGTFILQKERNDMWSHWSDAFGYALWRITKSENLEKPRAKKVVGINNL